MKHDSCPSRTNGENAYLGKSGLRHNIRVVVQNIRRRRRMYIDRIVSICQEDRDAKHSQKHSGESHISKIAHGFT